ncbi:MAG: thioredoxin domain-containing protein [Gemmatimonadales bacterium]|nr:thioredoxin domain-containing protein [Gemmatimonadales bacterium]
MTSNRLGTEPSAYLQSASHQPIHWYPWGPEPFADARAGDRPILLDIGAVWCHWCHVMDGESYEDPALAEFLNEHFTCIKVDRDERPDVDARYQRAVQMLIHQGGWPLTGFLTPEGDVFYGGTYFPPRDAHGRPSFRTVLESVLDAYRTRRGDIHRQAAAIRRALDNSLDESVSGSVTADMLDQAVASMARTFDPVNGGFGSQPKFPHPGALQFLLHRWFDAPTDEVRTIIDRTLEGMARGGMHDQLAGGFHRYSVDAQWIVPHFEKMSYDNSELLRAYLDAYTALGSGEYAAVARGIVRWVREVLADPAGGYAASQDADVGLHDDGDYFTWTREEAAAVLAPAELDVAAAHYDIGTAGEMHHNPGKNVLFVSAGVGAVARRLGRAEPEVAQLLAAAQDKLRAARALRPAPFIDRTRYTNWNAMMASAMLRASAVLADDWARDHAVATLRRIRDESPEPDAVRHTPGGLAGLLDDQVQAAAAALDAYEVTADGTWLQWAEQLMDRVWSDFRDADAGGLFDTAIGSAGEGLLPARAKPIQDTPTPSPNGVAGVTAARLHEMTAEPKWSERAMALVEAFGGSAGELGLHGAAYLLAVDWVLNPATHLVVSGPDGEAAARMHARALGAFAARRVVQRAVPGQDTSRLPPAITGMLTAASGSARGFLCTGATCSPPAADDREWSGILAELLGHPRTGVDSAPVRT